MGDKPKTLDWTAALLVLSASLMLIILAALRPSAVGVRLGPVAVVFGSIGSVLGLVDVKTFIRPAIDRHGWWYAHMRGMIGSYIAAVTAFSVNTFIFLPTVVRWLWPTAIGLPLIVFWIRHYRRKFRT
jgi:hypothetical protein